ncbi:hypothetical protein SNE26_24335 [Mucilaginibacter sp. cycad4]|uniref:carboxymuconolactone decarboxylase family protein n=1 Tax=Mucilaginibacter sp. cycad4 TaxID=3342096 RepID=UPI002AABA0FB|nr:carboxymuconolactone decarboxylase family protein [Mucilaginibacter gossypii]WPU99145.1 hypothetical protein SNE26_24335 [Mucilaginibacter gossypii]
MKTFSLPKDHQLTSENRALFQRLNELFGYVPNLYRAIAYSDNAVKAYLNLQHFDSSLNARQKTVVNLTVSHLQQGYYSLKAYSTLALQFGFNREQVEELANGTASFDLSLQALINLTTQAVNNHGNIENAELEKFFDAGYTEEQLVDVMMAVGETTIANYLYNIVRFPMDFNLSDRDGN